LRHPIEILMHVTEMPKRVRKEQAIPNGSAGADRFFVKRDCGFRVAGVTFDLRDAFQRRHQKTLRAAPAREVDGFAELVTRVGVTLCPARSEATPKLQ
jgi:hypothetical protein